MAHAVEKLLDYIVNHRLLAIEEKYNELTTRQINVDAGDIMGENAPNPVGQEQAALPANLPIFSDALAQAASLRGQGAELALKDTNSLHNTMADLLVRYLVRTDLASVRSEEDTTAPAVSADPQLEAHGLPVAQVRPYTYYFAVNWERLATAAQMAGTSLDQVLQEVASSNG